MILRRLRTTQHAFCPQTAAAGGMSVANAVFPVLFKELAMTAVNAGGKVEFFKLSAESSVCVAVPDGFYTGLRHIAEEMVVDGPADIAQIGIAIVQQSHTGTDIAVAANKGHTLPDKFAVGCLADHRLIVKAEMEILFRHQLGDPLRRFRNVHIQVRKPHRGKHAAFGWAGVHGHQVFIQHLLLGRLVGGGNVGDVDLIDEILGNEKRQVCQLVHIAFHGLFL